MFDNVVVKVFVTVVVSGRFGRRFRTLRTISKTGCGVWQKLSFRGAMLGHNNMTAQTDVRYFQHRGFRHKSHVLFHW